MTKRIWVLVIVCLVGVLGFAVAESKHGRLGVLLCEHLVEVFVASRLSICDVRGKGFSCSKRFRAYRCEP